MVAFDLVETVFSLDAVARALDAAAGTRDLLPRWFDRTLRDGFARSLAGTPLPFRQVAIGALEVVAPQLDSAARNAVLDAFADLPAHADVRPAMEQLAVNGTPMVGVTNSSADGATSLLQRAGLDEFVDTVISVEEVGVWKPHRDVYLHLAGRVGQPPDAVALIAVHAWDVHGAGHAGLITGWASRLEGCFASSYGAPDVRGGTLLDVVNGLVELPRSER